MAYQMDQQAGDMEQQQQGGMGATGMAAANNQSDYLTALKAELEALASTSFVHTLKVVSKEIKKIESGKNPEFLDLLAYNKPLKLNQKVKVPVDQFPNVNFVGKLLGPGGSTLKKLQAESGCRMAIFGRGSIRSKEEEEEKRQQGGKFEHLNENLHVNVDAHCPFEDSPAAAAFTAMGRAMTLLTQYMDPEFEDMDQMQQMGFGMNGAGAGRPPRGGRGRGMPRGAGMGGGRGRGAPRGRGAASGGGPIAQQAYTDFTSDDYSGSYGESSFGGQSEGGYYQGGQARGGRGASRGPRGAGGPMRGMPRGGAARPAPYSRGGARGQFGGAQY